MTQENYKIEDDTIDLRELFLKLKKRKNIIISIVTIFTLLAILYAFFIAKPVYSVKAVIEIGILDDEPIDDINSVQQKLSYIYKVNTKGIKHELPLVKAITASKKSKNILFITIHGNSNEEASKYIQSVIHKIKDEYQAKTNAHINNQQELIKQLHLDIKENTTTMKFMKEELILYKEKIISLKGADAALAGIYALQIGQKETQLQGVVRYISALKNKNLKYQHSLSPVMMKPTRIVGDIQMMEKPIKPKKILIILITLIASFMFSIFLALTLDLFKKKEES